MNKVKKKMKLLLMLVSIAISVVLGVSVSYVVFLAHVGVIYLALNLVNRYIKIDKRILLLISAGLAGWGLPFKTSAPAEYVIIDIQAK